MSEFEGVIGYFASSTQLRAALARAREERFTRVEAYLPIDDEPAVDEHGSGPSPVPLFALAGALGGGGFALWGAIWTSRDYPLVTGGMPITSLPPFLVTAFEVLILAAAVGAAAGFALFARLPSLSPGHGYRSDLAVDTFALLIRSLPLPAERRRAERLLRETGAFEVRTVQRRECGPLGEVP